MIRMRRSRAISQVGMSQVNSVDLPEPGGSFITMYSLCGVLIASSTLFAASSCHGIDLRPK